MTKISFFFNSLYESGVSKATSEEDKLKVKYLNQGMVWGTIMFIPNLIFEAVIGFLPATILNLTFIASAIVCFFINRQGRCNLARNFTFIGLDLILLTASITEGTRTGNYLIYSALILLFPILIKLKDKGREVGLIFFFTILCLVVSVSACPSVGYFKGLSEQDAALMFKGSFLVSFGLTTVLAYIIFLITQKREVELINARVLAEKSAKVKLQFLSNMSHELRTPLNGIIGSTNLLKLEEHTSQQKEHLALLDYSSQHMLHLVNDVLDFSKIESGKIQLENRHFSLQTFVENLYNSFAPQFEQKNLYFKLIHKDTNLNYNIDSDDIRLGQILNNLLSNALKFTHVGGVSFGISTTLLANEKIQIKFDVIDTGIGIKKQSLDSIFESFVQGDLDTTRKYGGTGLGLTISRKLAEVFDTILYVKSEPDKGSHFFFSPIFSVTEKLLKPGEENEAAMKSLKGMNILIAEDNKINLLIARKFLLKWEVNLSEANNGKEAIELCRHTKFDLLLLDLEMPEADGYTALAEIRKLYPTIPALAFTAAVFENIQTLLLQKGFNDYILKPFSPKELNEKLFRQKELINLV
jgi:signal transduction histidine kinase/ActR/RegA family two-component response regulator